MERALNRVTKVPFKAIFGVALAAGKFVQPVNPINLSSRLASMADDFDLYRLSKFRFRLIPSTLASENVVCAYQAGVTDTAGTFATVGESNHATCLGLQMTTTTDWVEPKGGDLRGAANWYKAVPGAADDWDEIQGALIFASSNAASTASVYIEAEGVMDFASPADPGLTPAMRRDRMLAREKKKLLAILSSKDKDRPTDGAKTLAGSKLPLSSNP